MEKRAVLGKGLSALISENVDDSVRASFSKDAQRLNIADIDYNSLQPRLHYDQESLEELKSSIREKGILQPILVRPKGDRFEIVAGERRFRAAQAIGLQDVPVVMRDVSDDEALVLALIENIQREELNVIEEAKAFKRLVDDFQLTQEQVADAVGKNRSTITNILRLLRLPEAIQEAVSKNLISMGHARTLLSVDDEKRQFEIFLSIIEKGTSVRQTEEMTRSVSFETGKREKVKKDKDHEILSLEDELRNLLGTKVLVEAKKKRGKIVIEYYSLDDLDRILEILRNVS